MPALISPPPTDADNGPWYIEIDPFMASGQIGWGDAAANLFVDVANYQFGAFTGSDSPGVQNNSRWWDIDFGAGGVWDLSLLHITGFDVGIYSIRIDDRQVGTLDGYSGPDVPNLVATFTNIVIPAGKHRLALVMATRNASSTGYYGAVHRLYLRRTASLPQRRSPGAYGLPRGGRRLGAIVDINTFFNWGNTTWDSIGGVGAGANPYNGRVDSSGSNGDSRWWYVGAPAGLYDIEVMHVKHAAYGIVAVQVDDVTVGSFDSYAAVTDFKGRTVIRAVIPFSGKHKIALTVTGKNGSSSGFYGGVFHVQLRQIRPQVGSQQTVEPWHIDFTSYFAAGNFHFDTIFVINGNYLYGGDIESDSTIGASRWYYEHIPAGTWTLELIHATGSNRGIYSVQLDDVEVGTIDGYGGAVQNVHSTVTGIKVTRTGKHKLALVMNTRNGSSSNYYGTFTTIQLRRTA